jgi:DNA invertase Pin-like site-specific DNA recombinase
MTEYTVALYIRLSAADEDRDGDSGSVINQRDLLNHYVASNAEFSERKVLTFIDDGCTGTNFDRPAAKEMLEKAKRGQINCIIVKDFSRFGRNYIEVGDYLEQIFPFLGVRFISVNDRYDSNNNVGYTAGLDVAFKTFIHSLYSKDLSFKTKNGRKAKAEKGEYLCKLAIYGYQKSKTEKNKIVVDEETAPIVRRIYKLALSGMTQLEIAILLNSENIDTPLVHRKKKGTHTDRGWTAKGEVNHWTVANVGRILRDIRYAGTMVNFKRTQVAPLNRKTKAVPRNEWIIVPDTHEGIVSMELYEAVQKVLPEFGVGTNKMENSTLFGGKVFCGHCEYALTQNRGVRPYFICYSKNNISAVRCLSDRIYEDSLKDAVLIAFKKNAELAAALKAEMQSVSKQIKNKQTDISAQLMKLSGKEHQLTEQKARLFEDFASGKISKEQYLESKTAVAAELEKINELRIKLENTAQDAKPVPETDGIISLLDKFKGIQEVTPEIVSFVKRINVFDSEQIEIRFTFDGELDRLYLSQKN